MSNQDQFQTIDPTALAQVSGGTAAPATSQDDVLTALTGILNSLQSMTQQNSNGGFNSTEMFMMMMVMNQRNQQQGPVASPWGYQPVVYY
ncbi:MAG TPA: hypothetical protein VGC42_19920 [Kofleriaceae bacterium]